jgi:hypothetical protein
MSAYLFISYSHNDERWADRLRDHLAALRQEGLVEDWYDRKIQPGENWEEAIATELNRSNVIIPLISANFLASDYCTGIEMTKALELHERGEARIVPIILRAVDWEGTSFGKLQALPRDGKPILSHRDRDQALRDVARGMRRALSGFSRHPALKTTTNSDLTNQTYFLNHTSFLRPEKQKDFQERTRVPLDHYDIRVIIDSEDDNALDRIERVEYILHEAYPEPIRVRTQQHRRDYFLLKELANGEYLLRAKVFIGGQNAPVELQRYITLWRSGPELP